MSDEPNWANDPLWYKDAIIYQLHVKAFFDSNNDGTGDFRGLTEKLDYVAALGVNAIWLLPFYPSPGRDDGYDISDYRNIHPHFGSRADFRQFVREAHRRGIKVITELVVNHTSDQHPWFQAARRSPPGSAKREFYVWSDSDDKFAETRIIFTDTEASNWAWDPVAKQYYWHRFFSHQPDLNHNNPQVVKAVTRVMRYWMDMGVDGMRLDAIPYLCVRDGTSNENLPETHAVLKEMRKSVNERYPDRMFLAEANQWPEDVRDYFGDGDECHMAYHFPLMPRMYMALAQEDRHPIVEIMRQTPDIPDNCQWAIFLRNHDELTLEMVTDRERDYMYQTYASDPRMRINVGIRRRLAPLLDNDPEKIKLMNSLLLSMPGSPIIYYGDEIGMGDNFFLGDRNGVRTPMQWSPDRNAGFSKADPQRLYLPPIMDPIYGFEAVNVEAQSRDPSSLLNWMRRIIAVRKQHKAFGRGSLNFLAPGNRKILAYLREHDGESILCVANMARSAQPVELDLSRYKGRVPVELTGHSVFPPIGDLPYLLTLPGYAFYWFILSADTAAPDWHEEMLPPMELAVLVLFAGWRSFFPEEVEKNRRTGAERLHQQMEHELLPQFLPAQRWFAAKDEPVESMFLAHHSVWESRNGSWMFAEVEVRGPAGGPQHYFMPLTLLWKEADEDVWPYLHFTLAKVRQHSRVGLLCDAFADEGFVRALVDGMRRRDAIPYAEGEIAFVPTSAFAGAVEELPADAPVRRPKAESSNTSVIIGDRLFLKGYRRVHDGVNPELEMGRFLTEVSPFAHIIPVLGALEYQGPGDRRATYALLQGFVDNQGDAWNYTLDYLERYLEECRVNPPEAGEECAPHAAELALIRVLGVRTGEMHRALCHVSGDPAFDPEPIHVKELNAWIEALRGDVQETLAALKRREGLSEAQEQLRERVLGKKKAMLDRVASLPVSEIKVSKTRIHGDYHLGQVLVVENDFYIIDFEGEPARPLDERRRKYSALRDVAGMLRSFSYVVYAALFRMTAERPEDFARLEPYARAWEGEAVASFLAGYREAVGECPVFPRDEQLAQRLIGLFTLEKALYELRYEMANRPDWVAIPLNGLLAFLGEEA